MKTDKLDRLDRKVLHELDLNSRQSLSELARKLRQGRDRVEYRVDQLQNRKILRATSASVNIYRLGFTIFKSYLRLENSKDRVLEMVKFLRGHPRVYWLALCDGGWDLMMAIFARNASEFHKIHSDIVTRYNDIVLNFSMYTLVEVRMFNKGYFLGKGGSHVIVGGEPGAETLDPVDYQILKMLSDDARRPIKQIAEDLDTTAAIVGYRIERLEKRGVITGFTLDVDLRELEMMFFKTQLFLRNFTASLRAQFRDYCAENPYITCYVEQLGDASLEVELVVHDYEQYFEIVEEMRGTFSKLIRNYQTILIRDSKFNWVPRDLAGDSENDE